MNTIIVHSGWTIAQAIPSAVCLYRTRMSRSAMTQNSSRYCQSAARSGRRQRRSARTSTRRSGGSIGSVGGAAGFTDIVGEVMAHGTACNSASVVNATPRAQSVA